MFTTSSTAFWLRMEVNEEQPGPRSEGIHVLRSTPHEAGEANSMTRPRSRNLAGTVLRLSPCPAFFLRSHPVPCRNAVLFGSPETVGGALTPSPLWHTGGGKTSAAKPMSYGYDHDWHGTTSMTHLVLCRTITKKLTDEPDGQST